MLGSPAIFIYCKDEFKVVKKFECLVGMGTRREGELQQMHDSLRARFKKVVDILIFIAMHFAFFLNGQQNKH